jgi:hypothetical protein
MHPLVPTRAQRETTHVLGPLGPGKIWGNKGAHCPLPTAQMSPWPDSNLTIQTPGPAILLPFPPCQMGLARACLLHRDHTSG